MGRLVAIEYHDDLKEVQCEAALAALLSDRVQTAPFDRLEWWQGLVAHCGMSPLIVVARDGADTAILPLCRTSNGLGSLANWYTFRWRPVLDGYGERLLPPVASALAQRTKRISLHGVPDADASALTHAFRGAGWFVEQHECDTNHFAEIDGRSFDAFLAARPGVLRSTIRRKSGPLQTRVLTRFDPASWQEYEEIYRQSWKPDEGSPEFLQAFAVEEGRAGRLRLGLAYTADRPVAAQMWTVEAGTALIHKLAHRDDATTLSPGTVLSAAMFRHVIDTDKVSTIDFGTGDDGYKADWMESRRSRHHLDLLWPTAPANWPVIGKALVRRMLARRANRG